MASSYSCSIAHAARGGLCCTGKVGGLGKHIDQGNSLAQKLGRSLVQLPKWLPGTGDICMARCLRHA